MNFWEAYLAVVAGKIVKVTEPGEDSYSHCVCKKTNEPFDVNELVKITIKEDVDVPTSFKDLTYDPIEHVCMSVIENGKFEILTEKELIECLTCEDENEDEDDDT